MKSVTAITLVCMLFATGAGDTNAQEDGERLELGKKVFLEISQPKCSVCHVLEDAGTTGRVGPPLDQIRPDYDRVYRAVKNGIGPMPPNEVLSEEELDAVAHYVSTVTGGAQ